MITVERGPNKNEAPFAQARKIISVAIQEYPQLGQIELIRLHGVVENALKEIGRLESLAATHERILRSGKLPWPLETIQKIKAIWVLSGSGYYREPFKTVVRDAYSDKPWSAFQGRQRLKYAGLLMRRFAQAGVGAPRGMTPLSEMKASRIQTRVQISRHALMIIFNGRVDKNTDVRKILTENGIIPSNKVFIYLPETTRKAPNTVDQINGFRITPDLQRSPRDEIGVISHAPHLMRASHSFRRYVSAIREDTSIRAFPLPSPPHSNEYFEQEIRGLLKYVFITHEATEEPYPYVT